MASEQVCKHGFYGKCEKCVAEPSTPTAEPHPTNAEKWYEEMAAHARADGKEIAKLRRELEQANKGLKQALVDIKFFRERAEAAEARLAAAEKALKESQDAHEAEGQAWIAMTSAAMPSEEEIARVIALGMGFGYFEEIPEENQRDCMFAARAVLALLKGEKP